MATCAYVDHVQDEIKVDLLRAAREMLQHERGWREIPVVRPDRHRRIGDHGRKPLAGGRTSRPPGAHLRAGVTPGMSSSAALVRSVTTVSELEEARDAALARREA